MARQLNPTETCSCFVSKDFWVVFLCGFQNNLVSSLCMFGLSGALSWQILGQELLAGSLGCHSRAHGLCRETEFLLLCDSKSNSPMVREHLGSCPLRNVVL